MPKVTLIVNGEKEVDVAAPLITIGRTSDNGIPLNDSNVSRYHARIEQREDGYWLVEQNSSNGTTVNGTEVDLVKMSPLSGFLMRAVAEHPGPDPDQKKSPAATAEITAKPTTAPATKVNFEPSGLVSFDVSASVFSSSETSASSSADHPVWIKRASEIGLKAIITNNPARLLAKRHEFFNKTSILI